MQRRTGPAFAYRLTAERTCSTITIGVPTLTQFFCAFDALDDFAPISVRSSFMCLCMCLSVCLSAHLFVCLIVRSPVHVLERSPSNACSCASTSCLQKSKCLIVCMCLCLAYIVIYPLSQKTCAQATAVSVAFKIAPNSLILHAAEQRTDNKIHIFNDLSVTR